MATGSGGAGALLPRTVLALLLLLAGGGAKRGFVYGASDRQGAYPAEDPVRPDDLAATIYHALGVNPQSEMRAANGRPVMASDGKPVTGVFA